VALVRNIAHPISLARKVLEKTPHTILGAQGANEFATTMGFPFVPDDYLVTEFAKHALEEFKRKGGDPNRTEIGR
jgi:isoaspartyl peptidase/L-asparaginase-like protein (Ntn-hydrolase superfamily)